jgi:OpgC protein
MMNAFPYEAPLRPHPFIERDLRLDFFRWPALWMIFLDHISSRVVGNVASWITVRNYGFSDAAESVSLVRAPARRVLPNRFTACAGKLRSRPGKASRPHFGLEPRKVGIS